MTDDTRAQGATRTTFEREAGEVIAGVRAALLEILAQLPGDPPRSAADLQRALGLGPTPAWQIFRTAHAADPLAEGFLVPGPGPVRRLLAAAAERGVRRPVLAAAERAYEAFEALVASHADDRASFDSMITGLAPERAEPLGLPHKRSAFRANSHLWGAQTRTVFNCAIHNPSAELPDAHWDVCTVHGHVGLRRFRTGVRLIVSSVRATGEPMYVGRPGYERFRREMLVPEDDVVEGLPLLRPFCSDPIPAFRKRDSPSGDVHTELVATGVGNESAVSYAAGYLQRNIPGPYFDADDPVYSFMTWTRIPAEVFIRDTLFRDTMPVPVSTEVRVFGDRSRSSPAAPLAFTDADLLCVRESIVSLGRGPAVLHTPDIPRYAEMVAFALDRLGWDPRSFEVHRCRVEYPVVQSVVEGVFRFPPRARV